MCIAFCFQLKYLLSPSVFKAQDLCREIQIHLPFIVDYKKRPFSFCFQIATRGCETTEMTLRRNGLGQLGFHVNFEGIVADVEPFGFAWKAGLRQGSRLVEICKVAVATLTHEQMIDLLRTSVTVKVVIIQPYEDGTPRR